MILLISQKVKFNLLSKVQYDMSSAAVCDTEDRKIGLDEELTAPKNAMMMDNVKMTLSIKSSSFSQQKRGGGTTKNNAMPLLGLLWCAAGAINTPSRGEERTQLGGSDQATRVSHFLERSSCEMPQSKTKHTYRPTDYKLPLLMNQQFKAFL